MNIKLFTAVLCSVILSTSCIREEALNAEADIEAVDSAWVNQAISQGILKGNPLVENDKIIFMVKSGTERANLAPKFVLTQGATISPENGTSRDFSVPQKYVVTSQDGEWKKTYTVSFDYARVSTHYDFEHWEFDSRKQYHVFYEVSPEDQQKHYIWASGNGGFAMSGQAKAPEQYPTASSDFGRSGKCVRLETKSTGKFGEGFKMPIAAGNLFIGQFNTNIATIKPLEATKFGLQIIDSKPIALKGWYKFTAGKNYQNRQMEILPDKKDRCDIYAVLYEVDPLNFVPLNGANITTNDRIVMMARADNWQEAQDWTYFNIPFENKNGKQFDEERLKNDGYAIAIIFTSSLDGANFCGAIGSTLYVDEVDLECEDNK